MKSELIPFKTANGVASEWFQAKGFSAVSMMMSPEMCDRPDGSPYGVASVTVQALFQPGTVGRDPSKSLMQHEGI